MAGNVWEWTLSLWGRKREEPEFRYPYDPTDGREDLGAGEKVARVLRGGAFLLDQWLVRCAFSNWNYPDFSYYGIGFRLVLAPRHASGH